MIFFKIGTFDVALLELKDFVNRSAIIQPICLPPSPIPDEPSFTDLDCWVSDFDNFFYVATLIG